MHIFIKEINKKNVVYNDHITYLSVLLLNYFEKKTKNNQNHLSNRCACNIFLYSSLFVYMWCFISIIFDSLWHWGVPLRITWRKLFINRYLVRLLGNFTINNSSHTITSWHGTAAPVTGYRYVPLKKDSNAFWFLCIFLLGAMLYELSNYVQFDKTWCSRGAILTGDAFTVN